MTPPPRQRVTINRKAESPENRQNMSQAKTILIADEDARSGKAVRLSLESRGHIVRQTVNGAKALEIAIRTRPDLVVASSDLPLIDGRTLVNLMHANPNTRDTIALFLDAAPETFQKTPGFPEEVVRRSSEPGDLVAVIEKLFVRGAEARKLLSNVEALSHGDLGQVPLADLLRALHERRLSATVSLNEPGATRRMDQGYIYLKDGEVINALQGKNDGEKAFFRLLAWESGSFEVVLDEAVTEWTIHVPLKELLAEGARQNEQWRKLRAHLPGAGSQLHLRTQPSSLPADIPRLTRELLLFLEVDRRIEEVIDHCSAADYQVSRTLFSLIRKGFVEIAGQGEKGVGEKALSGSWLSPDQLDRLREKLAPRGLPPTGITFGKVLVFFPDTSLLDRFLEMLGHQPDIEVAARGEGAGDGPGEPDLFPVVAKWQLASNIALRFVNVPLDELQRPLWSFLSQGAIGGLFVVEGVEGAEGKRLETLKPASDFFQSTCPLPIGYLIMGDAPVSMELKARLVSSFTMKGDNSLFVVDGDQSVKLGGVLQRFLAQMINH